MGLGDEVYLGLEGILGDTFFLVFVVFFKEFFDDGRELDVFGIMGYVGDVEWFLLLVLLFFLLFCLLWFLVGVWVWMLEVRKVLDSISLTGVFRLFGMCFIIG